MTKQRSVRQFCTAHDTAYRLSELEPIAFEPATDSSSPAVFIDTSVKFQEIQGFGGAFTEAAAVTLDKMPSHLRQEILEAYFSPTAGNAYSLCRTHINSCDFSLGNYAYTEVDGDVELKHFSIEHDRQALIPMIRDAMALAGGKLKLFASPWSPPAWMK
ncbi:MAG: glucosylceramidase, partial [Methylobacter sp.]